MEVGATRSRKTAQEMLRGTWALAVAMGMGNREQQTQMAFLRKTKTLSVLKTMERKESRMTGMFRVDPYLFGCLGFKTPLCLGRPLTACFLLEGRAHVF